MGLYYEIKFVACCSRCDTTSVLYDCNHTFINDSVIKAAESKTIPEGWTKSKDGIVCASCTTYSYKACNNCSFRGVDKYSHYFCTKHKKETQLNHLCDDWRTGNEEIALERIS